MTDDLTAQEIEELKRLARLDGWHATDVDDVHTDLPRLLDMVERLQKDTDSWKRNALNHRETLIGIADMEPDVERMKQWARDGLSGYTETVEATVLKLQAELAALRRQIAEKDAEIRKQSRAAEMSAAIMRDSQRTGGWVGSERTAQAFDRIARKLKSLLEPKP